jgi:hypothetical protein
MNSDGVSQVVVIFATAHQRRSRQYWRERI